MNRKELTEKILAIVHEVNIENSEKQRPVYTLSEMLSTKSITTLKELCKLYMVRGFSKMNKQEIIIALIEKLTDSNILMEFLLILEPFEWEMFKKVVKNKQVIDNNLFSDNYRMLLILGIMNIYYFENNFHYVIPIEIQKIYKDLEKIGFPEEKEYSDLLNDYAIAATNLYGIINQKDFVELFNAQNKRKTDIDEMFSILIKFVSMNYGYCFWEDYIVNDDFEDNDFEEVAHYIRATESKPRYIPDKHEFLKYADWEYIEETPQLNKLRIYINRNLSKNEDLTEDIIEEIYFLAKTEAKTQEYIDLLEENEIYLELDQMKTYLGMVFDLHNNSRLWINNGHTPIEIASRLGSTMPTLVNEPIRVVKIGRNEICPCGSGLKYKKCCST